MTTTMTTSRSNTARKAVATNDAAAVKTARSETARIAVAPKQARARSKRIPYTHPYLNRKSR